MKKCDKHPRYRGKNKPKYKCLGCLSLYFKMHSYPRVPHKPTKLIKSGKIYSRKKRARKKDAET